MSGPRMYERRPQAPAEAMQFEGTDECVAALREWGGEVQRDGAGGWVLVWGDRLRAPWGLESGQWVLRSRDGMYYRMTDWGFRDSYYVPEEAPRMTTWRRADGRPIAHDYDWVTSEDLLYEIEEPTEVVREEWVVAESETLRLPLCAEVGCEGWGQYWGLCAAHAEKDDPEGFREMREAGQ